MKVAVISFSGNVGKTTIARHLLAPRIPRAQLIAVESINAEDGEAADALRGRQFGQLQEHLQTIDDAIVDIGASNVEDLLGLMRRYEGSHEDFDCFVVPTVAAQKPQKDTVTTLVHLAQLGIPPHRLRLVFNMLDDDIRFEEVFERLLNFLARHPIALANPACHIGTNEVFQLAGGADLAALASDATDYRSLIARASDSTERYAFARKLALRRLAAGVVPRLDACFAALGLDAMAAAHGTI
jgi:hypothetical protein